MTTTENAKTTKVDDVEKKRFTLLVLMASILSLGSLAWSTWSFIDLYQVDALTISKLGDISLISLSAAATMDLVWSGTMIAQFQGQRLYKKTPWVKDGETHDYLPLIGWIEALFVAALLGYHGSTIGGGAAAFAAVLPLFTKLTWTLALNGLKDPNDLTEDEKAGLAAQARKSRLTRAQANATAEQHEADTITKERDHAAAMADQARINEIDRANTLAAIERQRLEQQAAFDLEKAKLEGENGLKAMRQQLSAQLQISTLRSQQEISLERLDAEQEMRLRAPIGINVIQGYATTSRPQLPKGDEIELDEELPPILAGLTRAERDRANLAAKYYAVDHQEGGVTKAAFCKVNNVHPPRLSEATRAFDVEWFVDNGLAHWMS